MEETLILTEQQKLAVEQQEKKFQELLQLYRDGKTELNLSGLGGTGKTQLVIKLVEEINEDMTNLYGSPPIIMGAAISHGAKNVLASRFRKESDGLDIEFHTIASLLKLKRRVTDTGEIVFEPSKDPLWTPPIVNADLVIIDECSQISKETKRMIDKEKGPDTTIIYLGDWHQTPPVSDERVHNEDSPTFKLPGAQLTVPFRYEGDIQELANAIADEIDKKPEDLSLKFLNDFALQTDKDYLFTRNGKEFFDSFLEDYNKTEDLKHAVLINYRKKVTKALAEKLREHSLGKNISRFVEGEKIVCKRGTKGDTEAIALVNHKVFRITQVKESKAMVKLKFGNFVSIRIHDVFTQAAEESTAGVTFKHIAIYLLNLIDEHGREFFNIPVLMDDLDMTYVQYTGWLRGRAQRESKSKHWMEYYSFLEFFNDFEYAYAVNTYVVQGDTYNNVYINLRDILSVGPISDREKLQSLYTAVTRARKKVKILV